MNDIVNAILIGAVQGLTEFLPISSSGHLALAQHWLPGWQHPGVVFDCMLHLGTLVAVFVFFHKELRTLVVGFFAGNRRDVQFVIALIVASVPTAIIGLLFKDAFEQQFEDPVALAYQFFISAGLMIYAQKKWWLASVGHVSYRDAVVIGVMQGISIAPAISRSGATVAAAMGRGIDPDHAARFSFFLSVPAILGATVLELAESAEKLPSDAVVWAGVLSSLVFGLVSIKLLVISLTRGKFLPWAAYCAVVGMAALFWG